MPPNNKKTSRKKGNKKKATQRSGGGGGGAPPSAGAAAPVGRPPSIQEELIQEERTAMIEKYFSGAEGQILLDWYQSKGRIDFMTLAKKLPKVSQDLRDKVVSPLRFCIVVEEYLISKLPPGEKVGERIIEFWQAAEAVALEIRPVKQKCWECGDEQESLSKCSRCKSAGYCGDVCQMKAWKGGHKEACKYLEEKYLSCEEAFRVVDEAHEKVATEGIELNFQEDYRVARFITAKCRTSMRELDPSMRVLFEPNMRVFYQNLQRVSDGSLWRYAEAPSLIEYKAILEATRVTQEAEFFYFMRICKYISFDVYTSSPMDIHKWSVYCGVPMPASRFLEMYSASRTSKQKQAMIRKQQKALSLKAFQESPV